MDHAVIREACTLRTKTEMIKSQQLYRSLPAVQNGEQEWLQAAKQLLERGECERAKLLLSTVLQAHKDSVQAYFMLVQACLQLGSAHSLEALDAARWGGPLMLRSCWVLHLLHA